MTAAPAGIDGRSFSTFTQGMERPFDLRMTAANHEIQLRNLPTTDGRKAAGDSGDDQGKQGGTAGDRCSCGRHGPHPILSDMR